MSQPFFSSRKWIKVWINEWREGTLRWQATDFQRAFWIDLLTLAGRSRYPGIVCAGKDADKTVGYPASFLAPNSDLTQENIEETLKLFNSKGMVTYSTSLSYSGATLYAVTITNWKKYQSDYEANKTYQQTYRARKKASSPSADCLTSQLVERNALEEEKELEVETEEETPFGEFWNLFPRKQGKAEAEKWWKKSTTEEKAMVMRGVKLWNQSESWNRDGGKYIPYGSTFLHKKLYLDEPWNGAFEEERRQ